MCVCESCQESLKKASKNVQEMIRLMERRTGNPERNQRSLYQRKSTWRVSRGSCRALPRAFFTRH